MKAPAGVIAAVELLRHEQRARLDETIARLLEADGRRPVPVGRPPTTSARPPALPAAGRPSECELGRSAGPGAVPAPRAEVPVPTQGLCVRPAREGRDQAVEDAVRRGPGDAAATEAPQRHPAIPRPRQGDVTDTEGMAPEVLSAGS